MSRANETILDELHALQANTLLSEIKRLKAEGESIPPALFAQVNKFLKDNGVDRAVTPGDPTDLLDEEVPVFDNVVTGDF
jgi:hypothetical protein